jgi:hypothetical protein
MTEPMREHGSSIEGTTPKAPAPSTRRLGAAARTTIKLAIASVTVGGILAFLGLSPIVFWRGVFDAFANLVSAIGNSFGEIAINLATYLFFGALIVVPVWLLIRLLSNRSPR